jgi:hypothetical protein
MDVFLVDDSAQRAPSRAGMWALVAAGGIHVPSDSVRDLERKLNTLCTETGFPPAEEFKWSPDRRQWMYRSLKFEARQEFFLAALELAVSCTVQYVAGEPNYAPAVFQGIKPLLRSDFGRIGGAGLKIHPDYSYANLYHWLCGDTHFVRFQSGIPLPLKGRPYAASPDKP